MMCADVSMADPPTATPRSSPARSAGSTADGTAAAARRGRSTVPEPLTATGAAQSSTPTRMAGRSGRVRYVDSERAMAQRMSALLAANRVRVARAQLKRDLKAGRVRIVDVIQAPPDFAVGMLVFDVLVATPKLGRVKARRVLDDARVPVSVPLGALSERRRFDVASRVIGR